MRNKASRDIATLSLMTALMIVAKAALAFLPNIELTTFLIIMLTLRFGKKAVFTIPVYVLLENLIFGFNVMWSIAYMYIWYLPFFLALAMRKHKNALSLAIMSGFFGLSFGFLCSFPLLFISFGGYGTGIGAMVSYWVAGIPFDVTHAVGNFTIMLVLYKPTSDILEKIVK